MSVLTFHKTPIRVLVVDDSAFIRHILSKYLQTDPDITVVGEARDGLDALAQVMTLKPDVVTLDVEMPRMDGLVTLQRIMAECPTPVVMLSALTRRGSQVTIQALMQGAVDFVPKPEIAVDIQSIVTALIAKIQVAARVRPASLAPSAALTFSHTIDDGPRPFRYGDPVIVIGASTGGPRALQQVLSDLPADLPAAVVVVQHMPPGFTSSLARRLNENAMLTVQEAAEGDRMARGLALLAPGGFHLQFRGRRQVALDKGPPRNYIRPSVDVCVESAVARHGSAVICAVLTGMGADGTEGARHIKAIGGRVVVEHESTSVVYGMPRSIVEAGLADRVAPLPEIAPTLIAWAKSARRAPTVHTPEGQAFVEQWRKAQEPDRVRKRVDR
jgi:two-component system chemotaxis response regulator CheB